MELRVGGFPGGFELGFGPGGVGIAVLGFECLCKAEQGAWVARIAKEIVAEDFFGLQRDCLQLDRPRPGTLLRGSTNRVARHADVRKCSL